MSQMKLSMGTFHFCRRGRALFYSSFLDDVEHGDVDTDPCLGGAIGRGLHELHLAFQTGWARRVGTTRLDADPEVLFTELGLTLVVRLSNCWIGAAGCEPVTVEVEVLVDHAVAIVIETVAALRGSWSNRGIAIIAVLARVGSVEIRILIDVAAHRIVGRDGPTQYFLDSSR